MAFQCLGASGLWCGSLVRDQGRAADWKFPLAESWQCQAVLEVSWRGSVCRLPSLSHAHPPWCTPACKQAHTLVGLFLSPLMLPHALFTP